MDAGGGETRSQVVGQLLGGQRNELGAPADGLRKSLVDVAAGGERSYGVALRKLLNDGEGALPDGTGGTENGESFQKNSS